MEFIDSQIESPAKAFTESFAFARYASTVAPVRGPRTVYLYKWLAIFLQTSGSHFMLYQRNNTAGWQQNLMRNILVGSDRSGNLIYQDVTEKFDPPLIGNPVTNLVALDPIYNDTHVRSSDQGEYSNPIDIDLFLNQMIGPDRKVGSMKHIMDAGALLNAQDGDELFWSYKDNITEGLSKGFDPTDITVDRTAVTGELQQVTIDYLSGSTGAVMAHIGYAGNLPSGKPLLQAVSYVAFDDLGEVLIAQTLVPTPATACILIEWIIATTGFLHPVVTPLAAQTVPYLIPIPDVKTIWDRAPELLPFRDIGGIVQGIVIKLYPQYADEAAWRAAGAHF